MSSHGKWGQFLGPVNYLIQKCVLVRTTAESSVGMVFHNSVTAKVESGRTSKDYASPQMHANVASASQN